MNPTTIERRKLICGKCHGSGEQISYTKEKRGWVDSCHSCNGSGWLWADTLEPAPKNDIEYQERLSFRWLYYPSGPAEEYARIAGNFRRGCGHGCEYCYGPEIMRMTPEQFHQPNAPLLKKFSLENAEHDLALMADAGDEGPVQLCFIGDPFDPTCRMEPMEGVLQLCTEYGVRPQILTKAGIFAALWMDEIEAARGIFGQTIVFRSDASRKLWEPDASTIESRWKAFDAAGWDMDTWLSIEPVIDPQQAMEVIARALESPVRRIHVGKWNHNKQAKEIDWHEFASAAIIRLVKGDCQDWTLKRDLAAFVGPDSVVRVLGDEWWQRRELYPDLGGDDDE